MGDTNASLIISAASFNGSALGILEEVEIEQGGNAVLLWGQGKKLPSVMGFSEHSLIASLTYKANVGTGWIPRGTAGTISVTAADIAGGGSKTNAPANMVCLSCRLVHRDRDFARYSAQFACVDPADTTALT